MAIHSTPDSLDNIDLSIPVGTSVDIDEKLAAPIKSGTTTTYTINKKTTITKDGITNIETLIKEYKIDSQHPLEIDIKVSLSIGASNEILFQEKINPSTRSPSLHVPTYSLAEEEYLAFFDVYYETAYTKVMSKYEEKRELYNGIIIKRKIWEGQPEPVAKFRKMVHTPEFRDSAYDATKDECIWEYKTRNTFRYKYWKKLPKIKMVGITYFRVEDKITLFPLDKVDPLKKDLYPVSIGSLLSDLINHTHHFFLKAYCIGNCGPALGNPSNFINGNDFTGLILKDPASVDPTTPAYTQYSLNIGFVKSDLNFSFSTSNGTVTTPKNLSILRSRLIGIIPTDSSYDLDLRLDFFLRKRAAFLSLAVFPNVIPPAKTNSIKELAAFKLNPAEDDFDRTYPMDEVRFNFAGNIPLIKTLKLDKRAFDSGSLLYWNTNPRIILDIKFWTDYDIYSKQGESSPGVIIESQAAYDARMLNNKKSIEDIIAFMNAFNGAKCTLVGYTDNVGNSNYNLDLSRRRANNILDTVKLPPNSRLAARLTAKGKGETDPIDTNATPAGRQNNRRVELKIEF